MGEPVCLSRERWELLTRDDLLKDSKYPLTAVTLKWPRQIDGVIFLPAEYVPEVTRSYSGYDPVWDANMQILPSVRAQDHDPR